MTGPYPTSDADGPHAPDAGAADLSYADVAAVPPEQSPAPQSAGPAPEPPRVARVYAWPSPPPAAPSEVDSPTAEPDVDYAADDLTTMDYGVVATSEAEPENDAAEPRPSIVDQSEAATASSEAETETEMETAEVAAEPEPAEPAVARMRAVQARLGELDDLPIEEHPARYEELHSELTGALAQIDRAPDSQA